MKNWKLRTGLAATMGVTGMLAVPFAVQANDGDNRSSDDNFTSGDSSCDNDGLLGGLLGNDNDDNGFGDNNDNGLLGGLLGGNNNGGTGNGDDNGLLDRLGDILRGDNNNNSSSFEAGDDCNLSFGSTNTNSTTTGDFGNDTDGRDTDGRDNDHRDDDNNSLLNLGR